MNVLKEAVFARDEVICVGQLIGIVVAETPELAERGAKLIKVKYGLSKTPAIITIEVRIDFSHL